jgi:hypothetical protein
VASLPAPKPLAEISLGAGAAALYHHPNRLSTFAPTQKKAPNWTLFKLNEKSLPISHRVYSFLSDSNKGK